MKEAVVADALVMLKPSHHNAGVNADLLGEPDDFALGELVARRETSILVRRNQQVSRER
jgi:hypothetical protein